MEQTVDDQVRAVGRANVSRAVSKLVKAGIVNRFYQGFSTNHVHQGEGAMWSTLSYPKSCN